MNNVATAQGYQFAFSGDTETLQGVYKFYENSKLKGVCSFSLISDSEGTTEWWKPSRLCFKILVS